MRGARLPVLWLFVVAIACVWFLTLDARHLLRSDEGRYAEIAREMVASGDWVTIRYNGLLYFEKPPFQMWMTAIAYELFGVGEWQARWWVATSGAIGGVVTMLAARRWFGRRVAWLTGLVLLATPAWNLGSHFNSLDMGVSGALACVLAAVLIAQHPDATPAARRGWMLFAWAAMAVAVLTKGLIGIALPGLVLVIYTLMTRDFALWRRLHIVSGALLLLAIAAPWFVLVSVRNPEFARFFFIHEHLQRYLSTVHHRSGPWWYFLPQLIVGFLPWLGLSWSMAKIVRDDARPPGFRPALLLGVWATAIFVFFSASSSKLPGYVLPIYPALAVLAALALDRLAPERWRRQVLVAVAIWAIGIVAAPFLTRFGSPSTPAALYAAFSWWLAGGCALAVAGLVVAWRIGVREPRASIVVYALTLFVALSVVLRGHESFGRASSGVDLVAPIEHVAGPDVPIYSVRLLDHTLPFYLRRTTVMVESPDELEFGTQQEPRKWLPTLEAFQARWTSSERAVAVMSHDTFAVLRARQVPMFPVAEDNRRVVVANFESPRR